MLKVLELFAGYGSQALALENLGIEFTSDISEIDKYAIQAYEQIHGKTHNWGDVTKIDEKQLPHYDLITYSFPCQDISLAGLQRGLDKGTETRSSLLWECERIIRAVKPKYLLMENVKNLVGEKHKHNFIRWLHVLEMMGYQNYYKVLNAKDYGVPQNRERVFVVSILDCQQYLFPNPIKLEKRLKDVLESDVDEKYYLSDKTIDMFLRRNELNKAKGNGFKFETADTNGFASAVTTRAGARADDNFIQEPLRIREATQKGYAEAYEGDSVTLDEPNSETRRGRVGHQVAQTLTTACNQAVVQQVGNIVDTGNWDNPQRGRIYSPNGCSPALNTMQGGGLEPKILDDTYANRNVREYNEFSPTIRAEREGLKVVEGVSVNVNSRKAEFNGFKPISPALRATDYKCPHTYSNGYRIRKLTPRECWRLMGVKDEQFDKLHDLSNTQLYKLAGNSIVVDVLMGIFKNLLLSDEGTNGQLRLI